MMWRRFLIISMVFFLSIGPLTLSWATCEQEDLNGTWRVDVWATDCCCDERCWKNCDLEINSSGTIIGGTCTDCLDVTLEVTGGSLTMSPDCVIEGTIETPGASYVVDYGAIITETYMALGTLE